MAKMKTTTGETVDIKMAALIGRRVVTTCPLSNDYATIAKGTELTVSGWWRLGVNLDTDKCPSCKISFHIRGVHRNDVRLVP